MGVTFPGGRAVRTALVDVFEVAEAPEGAGEASRAKRAQAPARVRARWDRRCKGFRNTAGERSGPRRPRKGRAGYSRANPAMSRAVSRLTSGQAMLKISVPCTGPLIRPRQA